MKQRSRTQLAKENSEAAAVQAESAAVAAFLFVLQLKIGLDALSQEKADLEQKWQQLKADQEALDQQKIDNETTFQKMVAGLSKASLIVEGHIKRRIDPDKSVKFFFKDSAAENTKILAPVRLMVRPIFNSLLGLIEQSGRDRKAAQAEREKLAEERERIKLENAVLVTEFTVVKAEMFKSREKFDEAVFDLMALRHKMTQDQLERPNAVVTNAELTPF